MPTAAQQRAALVRLLDEFDADILVNLRPLGDIPRSARGKKRLQLSTDISECQACGLCDHTMRHDGQGPTWPDLPSATTDLIVVTDFPAAKDRYTRTLRHALAQSDWVEPDNITWVHRTNCVPRTDDGTLRPPSRHEYKACEANLYKSLRAAHCQRVLLVGTAGVKAWRDINVSQLEGIVGIWENRWVVTGIEHPGAAMRDGKPAVKQWFNSVIDAINLLFSGIGDGLGWVCADAHCDEPALGYDDDALPWCSKHFKPQTNRKPPRDYVDERLPL